MKESNLPAILTPEAFAITDSQYGVTGELWECPNCGFVYSVGAEDYLKYYREMEDSAYTRSFGERALQARRFLDLIKIHKPSGTLLDIGAGCGILVEEAHKCGFSAVGVEPCAYLADYGRQRGINVVDGSFPDFIPGDSFDVVCLADVIEHTPDPVRILGSAASVLSEDGIIFLTTPDRKSFMARLMGKRWWHYRPAHIGYFHLGSLRAALDMANLEIVEWGRPAWYFAGSYLLRRLGRYLPFMGPLSSIPFWDKITIPLNLRDSLYVVAKKRPPKP